MQNSVIDAAVQLDTVQRMSEAKNQMLEQELQEQKGKRNYYF